MTAESQAWQRIADALGIKVISPFACVLNGERVTFLALVTQFGGPSGMIVDPDWSKIEPRVEALSAAGFGFSCMSIENGEDIRAVLRDWTWTGAETGKPAWM